MRQNCLPEQRRSEASRNTATRSLGLLAVASLAAVFVLRASWLACTTSPTDLRPAVAEPREAVLTRAAVLAKAGDGNPPSALPLTQGRLSAEDFAMLSAACPTAMGTLPPELLPLQEKGKGQERRKGEAGRQKLVPPYQPTAARVPRVSQPKARITGLRVASRPDWTHRPAHLAQAGDQAAESSHEEGSLDEGWLVSPDVWLVPEDREKERLEQQKTKPTSSGGESVEKQAPASQPAEAGAAHDWPILPPKPPVLPEAAPLPKISPSPEAATEEAFPSPKPLLSDPLDLQSPLRFEPDFLIEPEEPFEEEPLVEEPMVEQPLVEEPVVEESESVVEGPLPKASPLAPHPSPLTPEDPTARAPSAGPLFTAPPIAPSELPKVEEPPRESLKPLAPMTVPTIEPNRQQPATTPPLPPSPQVASPSAPSHLFAPPAATPPATTPSIHGAGAAAAARKAAGGKSADLSHAELFSQNCYPSAKDCAKCHEKIYGEWSLSSHAYAYVSPMFHKFEQKINDLSQGTVGTFCLRCHSPPGISMAPLVGQDRATPIAEVSVVARDGVGCISCHRVNERYGKVNGERRIVTGNLFDPVYGGLGGDGVAAAIAEKTKYKLKTSAAEKGPGQAIHNEGRFFDQLTHSEACVSCHQVTVHPGLKLEVVWEQYRASPACKKDVSCQDCHMGREPGVPSGYNYGPIAEVAGKTVRTDRKQSNHSFYGPGYSIAHPGIFPQHPKSDRWNIDEWMLFDWRAGWGTKYFEDRVADAEDAGQNIAAMFPPIWREEDDRYDARDIIEDNLEKLKIKRRQRELVMENGSKVDGPFFRESPVAGEDLKFEYIVANLNEGHNLPTASLGAQPQLWANVVLIGPDGRRVWESGYTDSYGDVCDIHSKDVQDGKAPYDTQLFNLQTMFFITGATGTDREFYLPVNLSIDQVAHLRPGALPVSVLNHPPFIRMESRSIAPLGKKRAKYRVPAEVMCQPGHYRLSFRMRSRYEPMYFMRFVGATEEMQRAMTEGILDVHPMSVEFEVKAPVQTAKQPVMNRGWMR